MVFCSTDPIPQVVKRTIRGHLESVHDCYFDTEDGTTSICLFSPLTQP